MTAIPERVDVVPLASRRGRRRGRLELPQHRRRRWWDGWQPGIWLILGLVVVFLYSLVTWLWPSWIGPLFLRVVPANAGPLMVVADGDGLVVRQEELLRAPLAGEFRAEAADGAWVLGQQVVARVGAAAVVAPRAGIIRYSWDGQEALWDASELLRQPSRPKVASVGGADRPLLVRRESGVWTRGADPVGRLVQPAGASLFIWLPSAAAGWLPRAGTSLSVTVTDSATGAALGEITGRVQEWRIPASDDGRIALHLGLDSLPESLMDARLVDATLAMPVTDAGRVIPLASVWVRNGRLGVFVRPAKGGLRPLWTPIKLLAVWSARAQVAATREQGASTAWVERLTEQAWPDQAPGDTPASTDRPEAAGTSAAAAWERRLQLLARLGHLAAVSSTGFAERTEPPPDGSLAAWLGLEEGLVAVDGLPEGARVVKNPGRAVRWRL